MLLSALFAALAGAPPTLDTANGFKFQDGDRIVWLGSTLVEREQRYGYWETALLAANKDKSITLRNLGWSGDTVFGDSRAGFDNPAKGFERMVSLTLELKPTVIFVSYGTNEAFEGKEGLPKFEKGLEKLLDGLKPANARIVLFTPMGFVQSKQTPDVTERDKDIALYADAIRTLATKRNLSLADLSKAFSIWRRGLMEYGTGGPLGTDKELPEVTLNGMHLTGLGYRSTAGAFVESLGVKEVNTLSQEFQALRKAVVAKNELFFYRWRPQNETYLFGFRKHEQGKNAKEVAEFDPLVSKAEEEIARLRKSLK
jgi:lysophospholipase L1-like esterase